MLYSLNLFLRFKKDKKNHKILLKQVIRKDLQNHVVTLIIALNRILWQIVTHKATLSVGTRLNGCTS